jgi:hypothetical protein
VRRRTQAMRDIAEERRTKQAVPRRPQPEGLVPVAAICRVARRQRWHRIASSSRLASRPQAAPAKRHLLRTHYTGCRFAAVLKLSSAELIETWMAAIAPLVARDAPRGLFSVTRSRFVSWRGAEPMLVAHGHRPSRFEESRESHLGCTPLALANRRSDLLCNRVFTPARSSAARVRFAIYRDASSARCVRRAPTSPTSSRQVPHLRRPDGNLNFLGACADSLESRQYAFSIARPCLALAIRRARVSVFGSSTRRCFAMTRISAGSSPLASGAVGLWGADRSPLVAIAPGESEGRIDSARGLSEALRRRNTPRLRARSSSRSDAQWVGWAEHAAHGSSAACGT